MSLIVEVNEDGALILPPEAVGNAKPHARFVVESVGEKLTLRPEMTLPTPEKGLSLEERLKRFNRWVESHKGGSNLPLEALSRESIYDESPFWATATPEERAQRFREWASQERPDTTVLPLEALSRESIYE
jgi:hypothetical protein